jgi:hypothetical protein
MRNTVHRDRWCKGLYCRLNESKSFFASSIANPAVSKHCPPTHNSRACRQRVQGSGTEPEHPKTILSSALAAEVGLYADRKEVGLCVVSAGARRRGEMARLRGRLVKMRIFGWHVIVCGILVLATGVAARWSERVSRRH